MYLEICIGISLAIGTVVSYVPQFHNIVKNRSVRGISELSLILLNLASMFLTVNVLIFSWDVFSCSPFTGECFSSLLPFLDVTISWLINLVYYLIFITFKIKNREKRCISGMQYCIVYLLFIIIIVILSLTEKMQNNKEFFKIYQEVLGISSAILNGLVYVPQIFTLLRNKEIGSNSILMYALQTPGNILILFYQAILFHAPISTWLTFVVVFCQQLIILIILIFLHFKKKREDLLLQSYVKIAVPDEDIYF
jgi:uncharacterized protein with PQ loop repeat